MDGARFDALFRSVGSGGSRRVLIRRVVAGALGGALGWRERADVEARCRPKSRKCGGLCCAKGDICGDPASQTCVTGRGTCKVGANTCNGEFAVECNNAGLDCLCYRTVEGATRCGNFPHPPSNCGNCTSSGDCAGSGFGLGAFCAKATGPNCCSASGQGFCAVPCPT